MITDALHALRALARTPIVAVVIVSSLAMGIGVNTIVFTWIQALMLRPLPGVSNASRFYLIETENDASVRPGASWPEYRDLAARLTSFDAVAAFAMVPLNVGEIPRVERSYGLLVSGNYFDALGLRPALGRYPTPDETTAPGRAPVVVVSYDYWQGRLEGVASAVGRAVRVNGVDLTVIGVTPEGFQGTVVGLQFDMWVPATMAPVILPGSGELEDRRIRGYYLVGKLKDGVPLPQAQADVSSNMRRLATDFPETNTGVIAHVLPFWRAGRGPQGMLLQGLSVLQGVMLVLLLAVCSNTANLVLARATARLRDIGVRLALGAGRWRVARLLLVESVLLALAAAAVGVLIAWWGTNALRAVPLTTQFPVRFQTDLDVVTLTFAFLLATGCALLFGAAPALQLARVSPQSVLRTGAGLTGRGGTRRAIMAAQVALAAIVLVVAALFLKTFQQTSTADPGFRAAGVLLATYDLAGRNVSPDERRQFADRVLTGLRGLPDVESAALAGSVPLDIHGLPSRSFRLEGRARTDGADDRALSNTVTSGYFATMNIPLLSGRDFSELNTPANTAEAVVNDEFVRRYIGDGEVLGRRLTIGGATYAIVGVVKTTLNESFTETPTPLVYLSFRDRPGGFAEMHVRTRLRDETVVAPSVRRVVHDVDPSLPVYNVRTLTQHVDMNLALRKIPAQMFVVLGPLILVLAATGIYAVVAYTVTQRTAEIGVRMAVGASAGRVVTEIIGENLRVILAATLAGWAIVAFVYKHLVRGALDTTAFGAVPLLLVIIAVIACWIPARRASRIEPVTALRAE